MFVRLSRTKRLKAGWLFALTYLLCVTVPSASFAFAKVVPHCLTMVGLGLSSAQMHGSMQMHGSAGAEHVHDDRAMHDHSGMHQLAMSVGDNGLTHHAVADSSAPVHPTHKSSEAQCCGMMCLTALPATLIDFVMPHAVTFTESAEVRQDVSDNGPVRRYRPPIS